MRVDVFLLSDAATAADGKLYIHGGGITRINVPALPFTLHVALSVRLMLDDDELAVPHSFEFEVADPVGGLAFPATTVNSTPAERPTGAVEGEESYVQLTLSTQLFLTRVGVHRVVFKVDGNITREMTLPIVLVPPPTVPEPALWIPPPNRAERRRQGRG